MGAFCFKDQSSSIKNDFIAIIFPHNFVSRASSLSFKEELSTEKSHGIVFGSTIGVADKDLFSDNGIDFLIESLMARKMIFFSWWCFGF